MLCAWLIKVARSRLKRVEISAALKEIRKSALACASTVVLNDHTYTPCFFAPGAMPDNLILPT